jgi:hypothetical protein
MNIYVHMKHTAGSATENAANNAALAPYYGQVASYHRSVPAAEIKHVYVTESMFIRQVIAAITGAARNARSIWRLMVNSHGEPGLIMLGEGITVWNASVFSELAPFMTRGGSGITLGCCYAAAGGAVQGGRGPRGYLRLQSHDENGLTADGDRPLQWCQSRRRTRRADHVGPERSGAHGESGRLICHPHGRTEDSIRPGMSETEESLMIPR